MDNNITATVGFEKELWAAADKLRYTRPWYGRITSTSVRTTHAGV